MSDSFWSGSSNGPNLDLPAFFDSGVLDGLIGVLQMGVLVSVGVTRDGGALGITILDNGRKRREYFRHADEAADFLRNAIDALGHMAVGTNGSGRSVSQKATRGS